MTKEKGRPAGWIARMLQLLGAALLLLLFTTEVVVRWVPLPGLSHAELAPPIKDRTDGARTIGHPYLGYSLTPGWSTEGTPNIEPYTKGFQAQRSHNDDGFRNPMPSIEKPSGVFRIATLGGSSTYGNTPTSDQTTWPAQLESRLNAAQDVPVQVINAGVLGWSTNESLINLGLRVVDYSPDLILVYHTINDTRTALWKKGGEIRRDNSHYREIWPTKRDAYTSEPVLEKSYTYLLWRRFCTPYLSNRKALDFYAIRGYDPADKDPYERGNPNPIGLQNFERNLISIAAVARAHGAQVMLATQACDRTDMHAKSSPNQWKVMDYMGGLIQDVCEQEGLLFCDARSALEAYAAKVGKDRVFTGEVHLKDEGTAQLATIFSDAIQASGIVTQKK